VAMMTVGYYCVAVGGDVAVDGRPAVNFEMMRRTVFFYACFSLLLSVPTQFSSVTIPHKYS